MPELLEEQRESWGTRGGFILAAVGSAVGLGNLWGFPYKLYSFGGGAFLIPYIIAMFAIGIPLMILEFSLGHFTQRAAPNAFKGVHKRFELVGWWGILLGFVIVTYYPVILAYCFSFLWYSIKGIFSGGELPWAGYGIEGVANAKSFFYEEYLGFKSGTDLGSIRWNLIFPLFFAWMCMYFCIFRGVKLVGKIVWLTVPLPWLMLLILAIRGLTLEGSMQGLVYYLDPNWSELAKPITWRYAFGQVFFSLSLAFGVMLTYASFLHRKSDLNNNAAIISIADFATSFVAGLAVFATLGGMAYATQQAGNPVAVDSVVDKGPGLAFVAFPYALAQLPYSAWFTFIFFFALVTLGIDSAFSITESVLASIVDKTGWRRAIVLVGLVFGVVYVTEGGLNWLGTIDGFVNGTWGIAFLGFLECVVLGWLWRVGILRRHANSRSDWRLGKWWEYMIRLVIPLVLGTLFFWALLDDLNREEGFLWSRASGWILPDVVGMSVMAGVAVLALVLSLWKRKGAEDEREDPVQTIRGRKLGSLSFAVGLFSAIVLLLCGFRGYANSMYVWVSLGGGIFALLMSNYLVDKYNVPGEAPPWIARWAGIVATLDISGFIAMKLFSVTRRIQGETVEVRAAEGLSEVSYIILAVVFLLIIGGLGWCFFKALVAAGGRAEIQHPEEVGG
ncbi:MAG: sodium-dependent transporter [Planctomycetota bacterium]|jgi:NSS family neurotransmitter:Na+ symporter